jgi:cytochrome c oxidase subunit 1
MKYTEDDEGRAVRRPEAEELIERLEHEGNNPATPVHLPSPSYFPFLMSLGLPLIGYGIIFHEALWAQLLIGLGALIAVSGLLGWGMEPLDEPHEIHDDAEPAAVH